MPEPKQEFRDLPHKLSEEERLQVARDHIKTADNLAELENEKKEAVADFGRRIKKIKDEERKQRKAYESGFIDQQTLCQEVLDLDKGVAYWIRLDTHEVLPDQQRKMDQDEIKRVRQELAKERQNTFQLHRGEKPDDTPKPPPEKGPFAPTEEPAN